MAVDSGGPAIVPNDMFLHQHSLRHLLRPEHYCSQQHFDREIADLFRPTCQFVAAKSELARDGDFLTLTLFDRPLLIRNSGGRFLAYENICSHRHCLLTEQSTGHQPALRCQYHGWEYDDEGRTARIPDARCFRPWDRENSRLTMFPVESCGDLLFIPLAPPACSLRDWLHPFFDETEAAFTAPFWKLAHVWDYDCDCNWKIPAENTLESYHVPALHQKFFGDFLPEEQLSEHQLDSRFTSLTYSASSRLERRQAQLNRWLGGSPINEYRHRHIHPNTVLVSTYTINYALMYVPTSPTTVRIRVRMFAIRGTRRGPIAAGVSWLAWRIAKSRTLQVHNEDRGIYSAQQRGLERSHHPGVIGSREERIFAFQQYVLGSLGIPLPADPAEASSELPLTPGSVADGVR